MGYVYAPSHRDLQVRRRPDGLSRAPLASSQPYGSTVRSVLVVLVISTRIPPSALGRLSTLPLTRLRSLISLLTSCSPVILSLSSGLTSRLLDVSRP